MEDVLPGVKWIRGRDEHWRDAARMSEVINFSVWISLCVQPDEALQKQAENWAKGYPDLQW